MSTSQRTLQETTTSLSPADVLSAGQDVFRDRPSLYSAFLDKEGPSFASFRGQGGEEIVIGVSPAPDGNGTRVTGSTLPVRHAGLALLLHASAGVAAS